MLLKPVTCSCTHIYMNCLYDLICCCRYEDSHEQLPEAKLERLFIYCLCWSLGGLLSEKERPAFDAELRSVGASLLPPK